MGGTSPLDELVRLCVRCDVACAACCDPADSNQVVLLSILGLSA